MKDRASRESILRLLFMGGMLVAGAFLIIKYLRVTGNTNQVFTDIVNEFTAVDGSNKSAERSMFYIFSLAGAAVYSLFFLAGRWTGLKNPPEERKTVKTGRYVFLACGILFGANYLIYQGLNWMLLMALILAAVLRIIDEKLVVPGVSFLFMCAYGVCGLYRLYVLGGGQISLTTRGVSLTVLLLSLVFLLFNRDGRLYFRGIMLTQLLIPFTLLTYLISTYNYKGRMITQHIPYRVQILIWGLIAVFVAEALVRLGKNWRKPAGFGKILSYGACVSIMSYNRFSGCGSIITSDLHHPFENTIGFFQIFELGQKPFSEYIPVSGLYSILHGFFLAFFGEGRVMYYHLISNLLFLGAILLIVFLLRRQLKAEWVLFISLLFLVTDYNRNLLIVPVILLLTLPKLIERKNLWLKAWFLSSFIQGMYYPVFGAAVCIGFMPLGLWQIYTYGKSGQLQKDVKSFSFWFFWILCFLPVILCSNILLGTLKHMKAMAGQTVYADGIARFGQAVPDNFFSNIKDLPARLILFYLFSFLIVISLVWVSMALFLRNGNVHLKRLRFRIDHPVAGFLSLSFGLMLLVAFSYTVIRIDIGSIYSRNEGMVMASFVVLVIVIARLMKGRDPSKLWVFAFTVFFISVICTEGFFQLGAVSKLQACYTVPEDYVYVTDDPVERLEGCFVGSDTYDRIEETYNTVKDIDRDRGYLGEVPDFGYFFLFDIKGDSVMELIATIKGYGAAQETVDLIRKNETIVGRNINAVNNYYLYHWLLTSGEYVWDEKAEAFLPNDGSFTRKEIGKKHKNMDLAVEGYQLGRTAGSWGSSMDSLEDIFAELPVRYTLKRKDDLVTVGFDRKFDGDKADFLYLEFPDMEDDYNYILFDHIEDRVQDVEKDSFAASLMKKNYNPDKIVTVAWTDDSGQEHRMACGMDEGKLLIPVGAGRGWLLNSHSDISISVQEDETIAEVPEINRIRLLKVREVE